jgi:TPR repeat protein
MYAYGLGTEVDRIQAYMWFEIAAALGDRDANFNREELEPTMQADEIAAAGDLAEQWLEKFAAQHPEVPIDRE